MARPHRTRPETVNALKIREMHAAGCSAQEIARAIGREDKTVRDWLARHGLANNPARSWSKLPTDEVRRLAAEGLSPVGVARKLGVPYGSVYDWMCRQRLWIPKPNDMWTKALDKGHLPELVQTAIRDLPHPRPSSNEVATLSGYSGSTIRYWLMGHRRMGPSQAEVFIETLRRLTERHYAQACVRYGVPDGSEPRARPRHLQQSPAEG